MTSTRLVVILHKELPQLRDLFLQEWPKHVLAYQTIHFFVRLYEKNPNYMDALIFSLDDDWIDGTYVILVKSKAKQNRKQ